MDLPVVADLTSCCFPIGLSFELVIGLPNLSEVVFRTPSDLTLLVLAGSDVRSFLDAEPTVLDLEASVLVVLAAGDEVFVWAMRVAEVIWFDARPWMTGLSFLPGVVVDRR